MQRGEAPRSPGSAKPGASGSLEPSSPNRTGIWQVLSAQSYVITSGNDGSPRQTANRSSAGQPASMEPQRTDQQRYNNSSQLSQGQQFHTGTTPGTQPVSSQQGARGKSAPASPAAAAAAGAADSAWLAAHGSSQQIVMQQAAGDADDEMDTGPDDDAVQHSDIIEPAVADFAEHESFQQQLPQQMQGAQQAPLQPVAPRGSRGAASHRRRKHGAPAAGHLPHTAPSSRHAASSEAGGAAAAAAMPSAFSQGDTNPGGGLLALAVAGGSLSSRRPAAINGLANSSDMPSPPPSAAAVSATMQADDSGEELATARRAAIAAKKRATRQANVAAKEAAFRAAAAEAVRAAQHAAGATGPLDVVNPWQYGLAGQVTGAAEIMMRQLLPGLDVGPLAEGPALNMSSDMAGHVNWPGYNKEVAQIKEACRAAAIAEQRAAEAKSGRLRGLSGLSGRGGKRLSPGRMKAPDISPRTRSILLHRYMTPASGSAAAAAAGGGGSGGGGGGAFSDSLCLAAGQGLLANLGDATRVTASVTTGGDGAAGDGSMGSGTLSGRQGTGATGAGGVGRRDIYGDASRGGVGAYRSSSSTGSGKPAAAAAAGAESPMPGGQQGGSGVGWAGAGVQPGFLSGGIPAAHMDPEPSSGGAAASAAGGGAAGGSGGGRGRHKVGDKASRSQSGEHQRKKQRGGSSSSAPGAEPTPAAAAAAAGGAAAAMEVDVAVGSNRSHHSVGSPPMAPTTAAPAAAAALPAAATAAAAAGGGASSSGPKRELNAQHDMGALQLLARKLGEKLERAREIVAGAAGGNIASGKLSAFCLLGAPLVTALQGLLEGLVPWEVVVEMPPEQQVVALQPVVDCMNSLGINAPWQPFARLAVHVVGDHLLFHGAAGPSTADTQAAGVEGRWETMEGTAVQAPPKHWESGVTLTIAGEEDALRLQQFGALVKPRLSHFVNLGQHQLSHLTVLLQHPTSATCLKAAFAAILALLAMACWPHGQLQLMVGEGGAVQPAPPAAAAAVGGGAGAGGAGAAAGAGAGAEAAAGEVVGGGAMVAAQQQGFLAAFAAALATHPPTMLHNRDVEAATTALAGYLQAVAAAQSIPAATGTAQKRMESHLNRWGLPQQ